MKIWKFLTVATLIFTVAYCDDEDKRGADCDVNIFEDYMTNTNDGRSCSEVNTAWSGLTAAGTACQADADADGICDEDEELLGTRTDVKDVFVEVDYMPATSSNPAVDPTRSLLDQIHDAFAEECVKVHFDVGSKHNNADTFSSSDYNYCGGNEVSPYDALYLSDATVAIGEPNCSGISGSCTSVEAIRDDATEGAFDSNRAKYFHYMILGYQSTFGSGVLGLALTPGNIFYATVGGTSSTDLSAHYAEGEVAQTIMHELGHNLSLLHGGNEDTQGKPNYESIMNYAYRTGGVFSPGDDTQWHQFATTESPTIDSECWTNLGLTNPFFLSEFTAQSGFDPLSDPWALKFSHGTNNTLNEASLNESNGLNGSKGFDFNCDGDTNDSLTDWNIDSNVGTIGQVNDYDDWGNLLFDFDAVISKPGYVPHFVVD